MNSFIQITRHLYEEPYQLNFVILASNGLATGGMEFYSNTESIYGIGESFLNFPRHDRSNYLFERGSERPEDNFGWYFRLRVYANNSMENCSIQLRMNNNAPPNVLRPRDGIYYVNSQLTDFIIDIDSENLKNLGGLLVTFSELKHQRLFWSPTKALVDNKLPFAERRAGDNIEAALAALPDGI